MEIKNISLLNVRNHTNSYFDLPKEVLIVGNNGSGKTSILESINVLFHFKGFKKQPLNKIMSYDKNFMVIKSEINNEFNRNIDIKFTYDVNKRAVYEDDIIIDDIEDYIYKYPFACYSPEDNGIINKDQQFRRSFIDKFAFYYKKSHMKDMKEYNRIIKQKQAIFEKQYIDKDYISALNTKIVELSERIYNRRYLVIEMINKYIDEFYNSNLLKTNKAYICYESNINKKDLFSGEIIKRRCDYGIHRDKIDFVCNDKKIEKFSSYGEKKTFGMLSIIGAIKFIENFRKISIIVLLDDFEVGLDNHRSKVMRDIFSNGRQAIYTSIDNTRLEFKNIINL